jgi:lysophospholipase L1-like esterase
VSAAQGGSAGNASAGHANGGGNAGSANGGASGSAGSGNQSYVGTWVTAQQLVEEANKPPSPGLSNNTLRQVVHVSIGGTRLRLRFSNEYGSSPVTLKAVHIAASAGASAITASTDKALSFSGSASVTIPAKQAVFSDPLDFQLMPLSNIAVSIAFGTTSNDITGHPGSRTTSYIATGDATSSATLSSAVTTDHWYILSGIDVAADSSTRALVALGDSITDGRGSTTNGNDRWPDFLAKRMQMNSATATIGMLNQGIGGNAVLSGGLGPAATMRFDGDVLKQAGVRWLIVFEGVNDIGNASNGASTASSLINAYKSFVSKAHAAGIKAFGATITPFNGNGYYSADHESARKTVNDWIRAAGNFDAVIDFDAAVRDPNKQDTLLKTYDSGDGLHLNPTGYQKLADTVDLALLSQ